MFDIDIGVTDINRQYVCVYPEKFNVFLGYEHPVIFVAQELKKGTCAYDLTLRHEKTHMQIYIEALDYFLPILKDYMSHLFDELGFVVVARGDSVDKAAKELNEKYLKKMQEKIEVWHNELEAEELKLDTADHYLLENLICEYLEGQNPTN
jgi:hypothetical protein